MKKWRGKVWMKERFLESVRFLWLSALKYMANITVPSVRFNYFLKIGKDVTKVIQCYIKLLKLTAGCIFKEGFSACPVKQIKVRLEAKSGVCRLSIHLADRMIFLKYQKVSNVIHPKLFFDISMEYIPLDQLGERFLVTKKLLRQRYVY